MDSHNSDGIVIEDCRHIFGGEFVRRVGNEQTCFSDGTVTDHNTPIATPVSIWLYPTPFSESSRRDNMRTLSLRQPYCLCAVVRQDDLSRGVHELPASISIAFSAELS